MRRIAAIILIFVLLFSLSFSAYSVDCDGYDEGYEWDSASTVMLINGKSNCNVNQGIARFIIDNSKNTVYICLILNDGMLEQGNDKAGFMLYIGNSDDRVTVTANGLESDYDTNKYSVSGAMSVNENNGAFAELKIGFKDGVPQKVNGKVRFIDYSGEPSDYCNFELINSEYSEPTAATVFATEPTTDVPYSETEKFVTSKTAKTKTTKFKTTKAKTTKKQTTKKSTTKKSSKNNNSSFEIDFPVIVITSPKEKTTKAAATTQQQDKKVNDNHDSERNVTIYYVEKEVIISNIYVTADGITENQQVDVIETEGIEQTTMSKNEALQKGLSYKSLIAVFCIAAFAVVIIWSVGGSKKNKSNIADESDDNSNPD